MFRARLLVSSRPQFMPEPRLRSSGSPAATACAACIDPHATSESILLPGSSIDDSLMKELTVKQLAAISGVTVRTLHHYDELGLLTPAAVGANGYRYYGREELLRLQRILFHRELGVPLGSIAALLDLE